MYYVSVIDGPRYGLLLGPFETHEQALKMVEPAREKAIEIDPKAHFYGFGTCKVSNQEKYKPGKFNDLFHIKGCG